MCFTFSTLVTDIEKSQYYILIEGDIMQIRQDVSVFPEIVTDIGKIYRNIILEGKIWCMNFSILVTDIEKIYRNIMVEEERLD